MGATKDNERFESGASDYAAYLQTPEGRLRSDLAFANLEDFLPRLDLSGTSAANSLRALDVGCGTGAMGIRLARLGFQVKMVDSSHAMLDIARRTAKQAGVTDGVTVQLSDATELANFVPAAAFDVILCHNLLEYVDDPAAALRAAARGLRDSSAILSILVRNQAGEVMKAALLGGDLLAAERHLTCEWGQESLYGGKVRLFSADSLREMMKAAGLEVIAERGVRVLADYLPPKVSREAEYARIFEFERKLGCRPEFAAVARYTHWIARRPETQDALRNDE